ncbi:hypothetical protein [Caulobacter hibisci]|uniref:Lipoprotein n=1 Tax=Caulobacter hibisci TaxID=2035993 RepID=A0ABS0SS32_9CAUL|nr:hypothetical protein [Caulobacter hibisci]MBI1682131.1 hypothetical protein [Caulobacter hibisci]
MTGTLTKLAVLAAAAAMATGCATAQPSYPAKTPPASTAGKPPPPPAKDSNGDGRPDGWREKSMDIGSQPVRDVGLSKKKIPPVLEEALSDPYSVKGLKTCAKLTGEIVRLNEALGPDYKTDNEYTENRAGKLAEAGGKAIVNSIIPFRSLVREISGAAPADRHLDALVDAGLARRGFLRGVHQKQGCKQRF